MIIQSLQQRNGTLLILNVMVIIHKMMKKSSEQDQQNQVCDYSDAYILVTGNITATPNNAATQVVFKNCAPFEKCRTEINETFIDEATHINITMPMYILIEYRQ